MARVGLRDDGQWRYTGWRGPLEGPEFRDVAQIVYSTDSWVTWLPFNGATFESGASFSLGLVVEVLGVAARANSLTGAASVEFWVGDPDDGGTLLRTDDTAPYDAKETAISTGELGGPGSLVVTARCIYSSDGRVDDRVATASTTTPSLLIVAGPSATPAATSALVALTATNTVTSLRVEHRTAAVGEGSPGSWVSVTNSGQSTTSPSVTLGGLTPETGYEYRIPTGGVVDVFGQTTQDVTVRPFTTTTSEVSDITHGHQLNASNTGVIGAGYSYSNLQASGSITTTSNGQVIEFKDVTGSINVRHNDVTIRYCRVRGSTAYKINFSTAVPVTGTRVEWCELIGATSAGLVHFSPYYAYRCNIWGSVDSIKLGGNSSVIECWAHDHVVIGSSHNDGIQIRNGNNINVLRSRIEGNWQTQTAAILAQAADNNISNMAIIDNVLAGGSFALYLTQPGYSISNSQVNGNWFAGHSTIKSYDDGGPFEPRNSWRNGMLSKSTSGVTSSNNWLAPVINHADTSNPYKPGTPSFPLQLDGTDLRAVTV